MSRVLLVEDDSGTRECFAAMLAADGHEVVESGTYVDAMEILDSGKIDCVVCDGHFPYTLGIALEALWGHMAIAADDHDAAFVLVSGDTEAVHEALARGMIALTKPVLMEDLADAVRVAGKGVAVP